MHVGDYRLDTGFVETQLDGVEMTFESPCRFRVVSNDYLQLVEGRLMTRVPLGRKRFRVESIGTARSELDPGTSAGIEASPEIGLGRHLEP